MKNDFVCEFDVSLEEYKFWAKHPLGGAAKKSRKKAVLLRAAAVVLSAAIVVTGLLQASFSYTVVGAAFLLVSLFRLFLAEDILLKRQYAIITKAMKDGVWHRVYRFSDSFTLEDGRSVSRYEYGELKRVSEDERYFVLWLGNDTVMRLPKGSFTAGEPDGFCGFVEGKLS